MARKEMILTEEGAQLYRTRALRAGDPIVLDGPAARLYGKTGWATDKPARAPRPVEAPIIPTVEEVLSAEVVGEAPRSVLDHDGDGKPGGSARGTASTRSKGAARKRTTRKAAAKK